MGNHKGSKYNDIGIKGIAPTVQIVPVNIFPNVEDPPLDPDGVATNDQIALAINWAYDPNGGDADVLSNSWGGGAPSSAITTAITNAEDQGRPVIFASGNRGNIDVQYPANVNGVITVGAIHNNGDIWGYSQRGTSMDLVAPSGDINLNGDVVATDRMGTLGWETGNYTTRFGGTSAACPQVSGVVCLMLSVDPDLSDVEVMDILQETATDMGTTGFDNIFGYGRADACRAVGGAYSNSNITGPSSFCNSAAYSVSSNDEENIKFEAQPLATIHTIKQVKIYNVSGNLIKQQQFSGNKSKVQMDISTLSDGVYFVEISDGINKKTQKLVISR